MGVIVYVIVCAELLKLIRVCEIVVPFEAVAPLIFVLVDGVHEKVTPLLIFDVNEILVEAPEQIA